MAHMPPQHLAIARWQIQMQELDRSLVGCHIEKFEASRQPQLTNLLTQIYYLKTTKILPLKTINLLNKEKKLRRQIYDQRYSLHCALMVCNYCHHMALTFGPN